MPRGRKAKSDFGVYLVQAIKDADMVQEEFYATVGITKPYFYDILTGTPPPRDTLEKMLGVLDQKLPPDDRRRSTFFDLAAKCRQEIPADINDLIRANPNEWNHIRAVLKQMLPNEK